MRTIILIFLSISIIGCEDKYQKAFEEIDKREYYLPPLKGQESWDEVELLSNAIIYKPKLSALYYYRAEQYKLFGAFEKAISDYNKCIEQEFVFEFLYFSKGECELKLKNYGVAYSDFLKAEKISKLEWGKIPEKEKEPNHFGSPVIDQEKFHEELAKKISIAILGMKDVGE